MVDGGKKETHRSQRGPTHRSPQMKMTTVILTSLATYLSFGLVNIVMHNNYADCDWNRFDLLVDISCLVVAVDMAVRYHSMRRNKNAAQKTTETGNAGGWATRLLPELAMLTGLTGALFTCIGMSESLGSTCTNSWWSAGFNILMGLSSATNARSLKQYGPLMMDYSASSRSYMPTEEEAPGNGEEVDGLINRSKSDSRPNVSSQLS